MFVKKECMSSNIFSSNAIRKSSFPRAVRLATALGAFLVLTVFSLASSAVAKAADDLGETAFKSNCVICHGADGSGTPTGKSLKAPDLRSDPVQKLTDAQIETQILDGKNNMPPFKNTLSKDQVKALVAYVHTLGKKK
ncbi:MAG: cytochrome c [Candidatus Acidiferrales bacterium]|jgi:mono/diheme cytochrome c family protein